MEFTKLSEVTLAEELAENATVLVEDEGEIKRAPKSMVGGGGSALPVYNADDLTAEQKIAFAKEYKRYAVLDGVNQPGGEGFTLEGVTGYKILWISDDGCGCLNQGSLSAYTNSSYAIWTVNITEAQYEEIKAAWEAMVGTEV